MSEKVLIGVDSGGTRTNIEIRVLGIDGERSQTAAYEVGDSLSGALAPNLIPSVLRRIVAPLEMHLDDLGLGDCEIYGWISAAGYTPWTRDDFVVALEELLDNALDDRVRAVGIANDGVSLLLGSRADGIVIAGTGSNVLLKSRDGSVYQSGGHEWVACDYGSGFWIGLRAIRAAYRDYEAGTDSVLLQRLRQVYGLRPEDDRGLIAKLRDLAIGDPNMKREIARFTANVCGAAERGDPGAQNIVKVEAEDLADVMAGGLRRRFRIEELAEGLRIVQCGNLLANDFYRSSFETQLEMRLLSGIEHRANIDWERVITGAQAAIHLAEDVSLDPSPLLHLEPAFRPAVVIR